MGRVEQGGSRWEVRRLWQRAQSRQKIRRLGEEGETVSFQRGKRGRRDGRDRRSESSCAGSHEGREVASTG